jgi:hypothetical protein
MYMHGHSQGLGNHLNQQFESVYAAAHQPVLEAASQTPSLAPPTLPPAPPPPLLAATAPLPPSPPPQQPISTPPPPVHIDVVERATSPPMLSISLTANQCVCVLVGILLAALLIAIVVLCSQTHSRVSALARTVAELARPAAAPRS